MGKRSDFDRKEDDKYYTPYVACPPVFRFLPAGSRFVEPCAGDGRLIRHFEKMGHKCVYACDLKPEGPGIETRDVLFFGGSPFPECDFIITNPPWERTLLHPMIEIFMQHAPTWLLFDADWMHTNQAAPYIRNCKMIVSVGRISWEGNGVSGMDNSCWYLFDKDYSGYPAFIRKCE